MSNIIPFGYNILVEPVKRKRHVVSDQASLCEYGKVIALGKDCTGQIKVGDTIGYTVWGLKHLEIGDTRYYFVPESDDFILGVIDAPAE